MGGTLVYGRWEPPGATTLPDLEGCYEDMFAAREYLSRLEVAFRTVSEDYVLLDALTTAALIRFARCFTGGKRLRLRTSDNATLSAEDVVLHDWVFLIRDKHVAHPVNRFETQSVQVGFVEEQGDKAKATVVSSSTSTGIPVDSVEVAALRRICDNWLIWLRDAMTTESARLLPLAQSLSGAELTALPRGPLPIASNPARIR